MRLERCPLRLVYAAVLLVPACAGVQSIEPEAARAELAAGAGREILERECLECHELDALEVFRPFYGYAQWRSLILTMRDNGARVDDAEVELLAAYLAEEYGTGDQDD
jgi:mono/diheme cytochrome c family protein